MPKHDTIGDVALKERLDEAHGFLRKGDATAAVHSLADAFVAMVADHPELKSKTANMRGRQFPLLARWPALGANLDLASLGTEQVRIDFTRERFAMSEAFTYYEFVVDTARDAGI